jgi:plastocyanin
MKKVIIILAILVVASTVVAAVMMSGDESASEETTTPSGNGGQSSEEQVAATITYTDSSFSPAEVTVTSGQSITFVNNSDSKIEPSSDSHPTHDKNPELNAGDIEPGESKTITLTTVGTWGYHNHYNTSKRGTIIVE